MRDDGTVKVLDFGLAKEVEPVGAVSARVSHSTITTPAMTHVGVILGTAAYMSPEQAKGRPADKRSDVWSFGVVLYEMLTGQRAFKGEDVSDTLALILTREPEWTVLPADTPPALRRLVRRCLARDPRRRVQAIGEARAQIEDLASGSIDESVDRGQAARVPRWRGALPWTIAIAAIALAGAAVWVPRRPSQTAVPLRVTADLGAGLALSTPAFGAVAVLSPDSALVTFVAESLEGHRQLYLRRLNQLRATPLSGTDDADNPFFSPDGRWIGFFAAGKVKKIAVTGGAPFIVCDTPNGWGGTWGEDGTIVFSPDGRNGVVLMRVSSNGGTPQALTTLDPGEIHHRWPQFLPGDKGVLFTASATTGSDNANLIIQLLPAGPRKVVHRGGSYGRYLTSGHLAFVHQGALFAVPFDLDRLEETGPPVRVVEGIATNVGGAQFDVSRAGTLVYGTGTNSDGDLPMQWMDREGRTRMLRQTPSSWVSPRFSPDGTRLAVQMLGDRAGIWLYDSARDTLTRLTSDAIARNPVWTPDGRRVTFSSAANSVTANIYWRPADGTREPQRLTESANTQYSASWHPGGKFLAFEERNPQTGPDLMILPMEGDEASGWKPGKPTAFVNTTNAEREPMFSPDGRWIAYWSNDSGRYEVYVRSFGGSGGVWQVSTDGGEHPAWSPTTRELFYSLDGRIMAASYVVDGDSFRAEKPRRLAETRFAQRAQNRMFDVHPRGDRFMLAVDTNAGAGGEQKAVFVFDFFNELRQLAPVTK